jgi:hypothetical protein
MQRKCNGNWTKIAKAERIESSAAPGRIKPEERFWMSSPKTPVQPEKRRNQPVVDLRSWADDHAREDIVRYFERVEEQLERVEERRRFDADMAELESLERELLPALGRQRKEHSMKTRVVTAPAIDADLVSRMIATYIDSRKEAAAAYESDDAASAAEYLLRQELETTVELIHGDDVYPGMTFELGVQFGIEAAVATLNSSPQLACDTVKKLFADLRADILRRLESARASKHLKAVV